MSSDPARIIEKCESRVREIVGERIAAVRYYEIRYPSGQPAWQAKDFDSVDFGLEIQTAAKRLFTIVWESSSSLGLLFYGGSIDRELSGGQAVWDVTDLIRWCGFVGRPIIGSRVFWANGETKEGKIIPAPGCVSLEFDRGDAVYIAEGEFLEKTHDIVMGDNVTVFFGAEVSRIYQVGPFMREDFRYHET